MFLNKILEQLAANRETIVTEETEVEKVENFEATFTPLPNKDYVAIHQASYRDSETDMLYKLTWVLIPASNQEQYDNEQKTYDSVKVTLQNITRRNLKAKVFMYPASIILGDQDKGWTNNNYCKFSFWLLFCVDELWDIVKDRLNHWYNKMEADFGPFQTNSSKDGFDQELLK